MTAPSTSHERAPRADVADVVLGLGFCALIGGIAMLSVPWAFITAGALLCGGALLLEVIRGLRR